MSRGTLGGAASDLTARCACDDGRTTMAALHPTDRVAMSEMPPSSALRRWRSPYVNGLLPDDEPHAVATLRCHRWKRAVACPRYRNPMTATQNWIPRQISRLLRRRDIGAIESGSPGPMPILVAPADRQDRRV